MTDTARPRILVIDDNRDHLEVLRSTLSPRYEVAIASDGIEGYAFACCHQPDAILLDIMMPMVDGYTVLRKLRANEATRTIPVVLVTALDPASIEPTAGAAANAILRKPCHAGEVIESLSAALRLADAAR